MKVPDFVGAEGETIIRNSRVCLCLKERPDSVFLRCRACKGCVACEADPPLYLACLMNDYCGPWHKVNRNAALNPKKRVKKYEGPKRFVVALPFVYRYVCPIKSGWVSVASNACTERRPSLTTPDRTLQATSTSAAR